MKERAVSFYSMGEKIIGKVYLPDDYQAGTKLPTIIPCSGFTGINAVYPALFARYFTRHGYACLGFDYRGWAPSEGKAGETTSEGQYQDIYAAYLFAQQQPEIDSANIGLFGWGFAAHNVIKVAADHRDIKAVGTGNGFYNYMTMFRASCPYSEYLATMERARKDRIERVLTGKGEYVNCYAFSGTGDGGKAGYVENTLKRLTPNLDQIIIGDYGSLENFPPNHSWVFFDSCMRINATEYVKKVAPRGLFIGGSIDDVVYPFTDTLEVFDAAGEGRTLYSVNGGHNDWMFDDDARFIGFCDALKEMYDSYLK